MHNFDSILHGNDVDVGYTGDPLPQLRNWDFDRQLRPNVFEQGRYVQEPIHNFYFILGKHSVPLTAFFSTAPSNSNKRHFTKIIVIHKNTYL